MKNLLKTTKERSPLLSLALKNEAPPNKSGTGCGINSPNSLKAGKKFMQDNCCADEKEESQESVQNSDPPLPQINEETIQALESVNYDGIAVHPPAVEGENEINANKKRKRSDEEDQNDPDDLPIDDRIKRRQLLAVLLQIREKFPKHYKEVVGKKKIYSLSSEQLMDLVQEVKWVIGAKSFSVISDWMKEVGLRVVQNGLCATGLQCEGFAQVCEMDEDFQLIWNELCIDRMVYQYLDPKWRLGMNLVKNAYLLHHHNVNLAGAKQKLDQPVTKKPKITPNVEPPQHGNLSTFAKPQSYEDEDEGEDLYDEEGNELEHDDEED